MLTRSWKEQLIFHGEESWLLCTCLLGGGSDTVENEDPASDSAWGGVVGEPWDGIEAEQGV